MTQKSRAFHEIGICSTGMGGQGNILKWEGSIDSGEDLGEPKSGLEGLDQRSFYDDRFGRSDRFRSLRAIITALPQRRLHGNGLYIFPIS